MKHKWPFAPRGIWARRGEHRSEPELSGHPNGRTIRPAVRKREQLHGRPHMLFDGGAAASISSRCCAGGKRSRRMCWIPCAPKRCPSSCICLIMAQRGSRCPPMLQRLMKKVAHTPASRNNGHVVTWSAGCPSSKVSATRERASCGASISSPKGTTITPLRGNEARCCLNIATGSEYRVSA